MSIEWDPAKNAANVAKHGLSLADFAGFDVTLAVLVDDRRDYGDSLPRLWPDWPARLQHRLHRDRDGIRLINFRRAHEKELRRYG